MPPGPEAHAQPRRPIGQQAVGGIFLVILAAWVLSLLDTSGKYLMGDRVGVSLLLLSLARYGVHTAVSLVLVVPAQGWRILRSKRPAAQLARGIAALSGTLSIFMALHYLPQAQVTAINFLSPLIVLATAPWVLKEPPFISRWVACGTGFLGVLIVIRPGAGLDPIGILLGLMTACIMAAIYITSRRVAVDNPYTTLIWGGVVGVIPLFLLLPLFWQETAAILAQLTLAQWGILLSTGLYGCLGHLLQIQAYWRAPASLLSPFLYFQIISAAGLGWLVWGDMPDAVSWLGIAIVCASGIGIGMIEWRRR